MMPGSAPYTRETCQQKVGSGISVGLLALCSETPHPHGVQVHKLLALEVSHRTGPVHGQVNRSDDSSTVQNAV